MRKIILSLGFLVFTVLSCVSQQQEGILVEEPNVFEQKMLDKDVQLIDVRTPQEFANGHISNATNMNVNDADFETQIAKLDKNRPVMLYCRSGARSANASSILKQNGFKTIIDLKGGINNWQSSGKPISN